MDNDDIRDMFSSLGPVSIRKMFGGKGIYLDGTIIAIEFGGDMLLKGDEHTAPLLEAAGATRWTYENKAGKSVKMPYWSMPLEAYDDPDEMAKWVRLALDAALRVK